CYRPTQFFFFQAEDGIRDRNVTGVQTCALPISIELPMPGLGQRTRLSGPSGMDPPELRGIGPLPPMLGAAEGIDPAAEVDRQSRSEERRVGKEGRRGGRGEP